MGRILYESGEGRDESASVETNSDEFGGNHLAVRGLKSEEASPDDVDFGSP